MRGDKSDNDIEVCDTSAFPADVIHFGLAEVSRPVSANSKGDEPSASHELKPSKEVESKMRPVSADAFHGLLRRAATQPVHSPVPKAK